ncbi:hypothetical protein V6N11_029317 [Hibiscus sabdariffa]|uniref:Uncharacterized protein n=2 Tax=Hibiscus sabdariffa TaxID=183260 RepID=A0ABR2ARR6_9ROSI
MARFKEPHGASVVSPEDRLLGEQTRVASPCWQVNCLWDSGRVVSDGNVVKKARSLDVVEGNVGESDALTCFGGGCRGVCSADDLLSSPAALGVTGAALAPVLGSVPDGVRKVKSVNRLVDVLASPEQRRSIAAARARRGRGRPAKTCVLLEADSDLANESLTDSDIQVR